MYTSARKPDHTDGVLNLSNDLLLEFSVCLKLSSWFAARTGRVSDGVLYLSAWKPLRSPAGRAPQLGKKEPRHDTEHWTSKIPLHY